MIIQKNPRTSWRTEAALRRQGETGKMEQLGFKPGTCTTSTVEAEAAEEGQERASATTF